MSKRNRAALKRLRQQVFKRDNYTCRYCGAHGPLIRLHADHVYPESKGGETTLDNLVTACSSCNVIKKARVGVWPRSKGIERVRQWPYALMAFGVAIVVAAMAFNMPQVISIGGIVLAIGLGADLVVDW